MRMEAWVEAGKIFVDKRGRLMEEVARYQAGDGV